MSHNESNRLAHCQTADGQVFFGGLNGVTFFLPDQFEGEKREQDAPLAVSECRVFDQRKNKLVDKLAELLADNQITVQPNDASVTLDFSLLTFEEMQQVRYSWRVEGVDGDWHFQKEHTLSLGRLPYGTHTLRIRGQAADGQFSAQELAIKIVVVRPFYATWWFWLLVLAAAGMAIWQFIRWRTRQQVRENLRLEREVARQTATIQSQADELKRVDAAKTRFFANVSHELRTPLTLLLGPLGTMLKRGKLDNRDFTLAKLMQQNGQQLLKLVGEILDLQKLGAGKLELHPKPVQLYPLLKRIAAQFESLAQVRGIGFTFVFRAEKHLQLALDAPKLETVLNNLLSNALKFTPAEGRVEVRVDDLAHSLRIAVTDTGRGIHAEDLPHIFDRFFQSKLPDAPAEGGTGIGLALCHEIAGLFDGKISAESPIAADGDNPGSRFVFEFPKNEVLGMATTDLELVDENIENQAVEPSSVHQSTSHQINQPTILLVEDNPSLRAYIQSLLAEKFNLLTAENGRDALEKLSNPQILNSSPKESARTNPHLIISDVMMPVMDGFQLLEKLKTDDRFRHIPVVMLTARADAEDKLRALRIGVDDYILKPFDEEELLARVENLLKNAAVRLTLDIGQETLDSETQNPDDANPTSNIQRLTSEDMAWLENVELLVHEKLADSQFSIEALGGLLFLSPRQLQRRMQVVAGMSPREYLREMRLQHARRQLETRAVSTVKEAVWSAGFRDLEHFTGQFRERFGKNPSEFLR